MPGSSERLVSVLNSTSLLERLAAIEHERWSHWQRYLHSQCERANDGSLIIPAELVERWTTQMNMSYAELSDQEKESDREQVQRYLPVVADALTEV
ncbi:hypothetical protein [Fodinicola acaciae]|uniref:hypothetical protein n=1 Tax=Fodinicola acaciae TaxID=2681555 RepID=UPI0013D5A933|nr:hypothetical protein [Fodinicola acaciae]